MDDDDEDDEVDDEEDESDDMDCEGEDGDEMPPNSKRRLAAAAASSSSGLKKSAAGLCVSAGSFSDPSDMPGLAHFLEHMVFMGSEKYPDENSFDDFIQRTGGTDNAHTDCETTVFYFETQRKSFREGSKSTSLGECVFLKLHLQFIIWARLKFRIKSSIKGRIQIVPPKRSLPHSQRLEGFDFRS